MTIFKTYFTSSLELTYRFHFYHLWCWLLFYNWNAYHLMVYEQLVGLSNQLRSLILFSKPRWTKVVGSCWCNYSLYIFVSAYIIAIVWETLVFSYMTSDHKFVITIFNFLVTKSTVYVMNNINIKFYIEVHLMYVTHFIHPSNS